MGGSSWRRRGLRSIAVGEVEKTKDNRCDEGLWPGKSPARPRRGWKRGSHADAEEGHPGSKSGSPSPNTRGAMWAGRCRGQGNGPWREGSGKRYLPCRIGRWWKWNVPCLHATLPGERDILKQVAGHVHAAAKHISESCSPEKVGGQGKWRKF